MATEGKNLSDYNAEAVPPADGLSFGIAVSEWNGEITGNLLKGALQGLKENGVEDEAITVHHVPGSFELPLGAQLLLEDGVDAVICIGSVIRGETAHFDFVCQACAQGVKDVSLKFGKPVIFGVLTDDNIEQSRARSGGAHGNKGTEAAISAIKMAYLTKERSGSWGF